MKKAFPANINGSIYYIDEDAYTLLNRYLTELRNTFSGAEGKEIVQDMEGRIAEHFDERQRGGSTRVINIDDVTAVIGVMGRPEQLSDTETETDGTSDDAGGEGPSDDGQAAPPPFAGRTGEPVRKRLYRDPRDRVLGGVIGGLGAYLGWDPAIMRVAITIFAICTAVWPCFLIYLICWMVIPMAKGPKEILEMQGEPVNFSTLGQTVVDTTADAVRGVSTGFRGMINNVFRIVGAFFGGLIGLCAGIGALIFIIIAIVVSVGIIIFAAGGSAGLIRAMDVPLTTPYITGFGIILAMLAAALPLIALTWGACVLLFKAPGASKGMMITGLVFEIIFIAGAAILINLGNAWPMELACLSAPAAILTANLG